MAAPGRSPFGEAYTNDHVLPPSLVPQISSGESMPEPSGRSTQTKTISGLVGWIAAILMAGDGVRSGRNGVAFPRRAAIIRALEERVGVDVPAGNVDPSRATCR